jgi:hypothetical protein
MADYEETMVETEDNDEQVDEILPDDIVEEEEDEGPEVSLESFTEESGEEEGETEEQEAPSGKQGTSEPGYVQGRIAKAVDKAVRETEARLTAQFEAQYAPIRERLLEMDAMELVKKGEVKNLELAKELLRYRNGQQPVSEPKAEQPRNEQGQFTSQQDKIESAKIEQHVDMLYHQAQKIKASGGPDVIAAFKENEDIKNRVISGEIDFYDLAEELSKPKKKPPAPMRSPNGANAQTKGSIMSMSDKQFDALVKAVQGGKRIRG